AWGQPFILRESSALRTLGGGQVLQLAARKVRRRHTEMLQWIERLVTTDVDQRALAAAWLREFAGMTPAALVREAGVGPEEAGDRLGGWGAGGVWVGVQAGQPRTGLFLPADVVRRLKTRIREGTARLHEQPPLVPLHDRHKIHGQLAYL